MNVVPAISKEQVDTQQKPDTKSTSAVANAAKSMKRKQQGSTLADRLTKIESQLRYLSDLAEIHKVQAQFMQYMMTFQRERVVQLFAETPETEVEVAHKGALVGPDAARRYFLRAGRPDGPHAPGVMIIHESVNPVIEVDSTGKHAKALWISPGITTLPIDGKLTATWNWGKFEMEYLKMEGKWKILKFHWRHIFMATYDKGWIDGSISSEGAGPAFSKDRSSAPDYYEPYSPTGMNRFYPLPPEPYSSAPIGVK